MAGCCCCAAGPTKLVPERGSEAEEVVGGGWAPGIGETVTRAAEVVPFVEVDMLDVGRGIAGFV